MRPLHIAMLDEELPYPLTTGKRIRTFNLLARLAPRHRVTILCHKNPNKDEEMAAEAALERLGVKSIVVDRAVPPKAGPGFYTRLAGNLLSPLPYSVATHTSPALAAAIRNHAVASKVDMWHCEWTPYAQVLRDAMGGSPPNVPWCVMATNVESVIWRRYAENTDNPVKRWYIRQQFRKFERFERWAFSTASAAIAVTREDAVTIYNDFGARNVYIVDNGVDLDYFQPHRDVERDTSTMLFLGSLDWRPNQDAAVQLLTRVLPRMRQHVPSARAILVGRRPPQWLREKVATTPGAELHPDVPDVRPYLARCGFLIVPLRIGGGSRLKILEALATGTPVVSTRVGAEGLELTPARDLLITNTVDELTQAAVAAIRWPDEMAELAQNGRRQVVARYSWDLLSERMEIVWNSLVQVPQGTIR